MTHGLHSIAGTYEAVIPAEAPAALQRRDEGIMAFFQREVAACLTGADPAEKLAALGRQATPHCPCLLCCSHGITNPSAVPLLFCAVRIF